MNLQNIKKYQLSQTQSYIVGFMFSIILTLIPYFIVVKGSLSGDSLIFGLMGYAVLQFWVQALFFLHIGSEKKPRWKTVSLIFMISVVLFVAVGTLWIMKNLNYNMMPSNNPKATEQKLLEDQNYKNYTNGSSDHGNMDHSNMTN